MSDGPSSSEMRQNQEDLTDVSASEYKTPRINFGREIIKSASRKIRGFLQISKEPEKIVEPNATANSYITEEAEDQNLLKQLEQVDSLEKQLAILHEQVQQSTLPSLDKFPPEFAEALLGDREVFNQLMIKTQKGENTGLLQVPVVNIPYSEVGSVFGLMSLPKEYLLEYLFRAKKIFQLFGGQSLFARTLLKEAIESTEWQLRHKNDEMQLTEELRRGEHYFSHGILAKDSLKDVFESGYICSIQSQLDRFGKAHHLTFSGTGSAVEYPDRIQFIPRHGNQRSVQKNKPEMSFEEQKIIESSLSERDEILFCQDSLYYTINQITFIFPAAELLQDSSWAEFDGTHLFAQDYDPRHNRKGYEISLKNRPHLIVTSIKNRNQVCGLIVNVDWITDKEKYIKDSVVFIDSEDQRGLAISEQIGEIVRDRFKAQDYSNLGTHVVPTGAELDSPNIHLMKRA